MLCVPVCTDIISLCELEKPNVPIPVRPGQSFRLTSAVNEVTLSHVRAVGGSSGLVVRISMRAC